MDWRRTMCISAADLRGSAPEEPLFVTLVSTRFRAGCRV